MLRAIAVLMTVFAHLPITTAPFIGTSMRSPWFMGVPIFSEFLDGLLQVLLIDIHI